MIWSEGMFLQPQHFQQQDRYFEFIFRNYLSLFHSYSWGFDNLELDHSLLPLGKIGIKQCRCLFPDGTFIDIPSNASAPCPLELPANITNCTLFLAIPLRRTDFPEVTDTHDTINPIRYVAVSKLIHNNTSDLVNDTTSVTVGDPRLTLVTSTNNTAYCYLAIAHVKQIVPGKGIILSETFIPPLLNSNQNSILQGYMNELLTLLIHRAEILAVRVAGIDEGGISELADFILLQLMNRYIPLLNSITQSSPNHPFQVYHIFSQLLAEMTTFARKNAQQPTPYDHTNLEQTFTSLITTLRESFLLIINQNAQSLPVELHKPGLWIVKIPNKELLETADFILAVRAYVTPDELRQELPKILKVSSFEDITDVITYSLPGIGLEALSVVPRKIPFYAGFTYFALDQAGELWEHLQTSSALAFHLSSLLPDFQFEVWTIQRTAHQTFHEG